MTLTLEITSEAVAKKLIEHARSHGRTVEEEALAAIESLPVTQEEYAMRRERALVRGPLRATWDGIDEVLAGFPSDYMSDLEKLLPETRKEITP